MGLIIRDNSCNPINHGSDNIGKNLSLPNVSSKKELSLQYENRGNHLNSSFRSFSAILRADSED